jgi:hypothetical protein
MKSLTEEYNLGKGTLRYWLKNTRKECAETKDFTTIGLERLRRQNVELVRENQKKECQNVPERFKNVLLPSIIGKMA